MIKMQQDVLTNMQDCHLAEGAGHWVQQEQPEKGSALLAEPFCRMRLHRRLHRPGTSLRVLCEPLFRELRQRILRFGE